MRLYRHLLLARNKSQYCNLTVDFLVMNTQLGVYVESKRNFSTLLRTHIINNRHFKHK